MTGKNRRQVRLEKSRRRLSIEVLENRSLLASLFYWSSSEKVELTEQVDQFAVKILDTNLGERLSELTSFDGLLADYRADSNVSTDVWRLEKKSPIGPFLTSPVNADL